MRKKEELENPRSCLNKARNDELLFVLLARDDATPDTIRFWVRKRLELKLNQPDDLQLVEALALAHEIEVFQRQAKGWVADMTSKGRF